MLFTADGLPNTFVPGRNLMFRTRAAALPYRRGVSIQVAGMCDIDVLVRDTHTCYRGERSRLLAWGHGCGRCPTCEPARAGYEEWTHA